MVIKQFQKKMTLILCGLMVIIGGAEAETYKVGILAHKGADHAKKVWQPLMDFLHEKTGDTFLIIPLKFKSVDGAIKSHAIDLFFANPMLVVGMKKKHGITPVASHDRPFSAAVIVRNNSQINTLKELKGKKIAATQPNAFLGYVVQMHVLKKAGVTKEDFAAFKFTGNLMLVIEAVMKGESDAGFIKNDEITLMVNAGKIKADTFRKLEPDVVGKQYPNWILCNVAIPQDKIHVIQEAIILKEDFIKPVDLTPIEEIMKAMD